MNLEDIARHGDCSIEHMANIACTISYKDADMLAHTLRHMSVSDYSLSYVTTGMGVVVISKGQHQRFVNKHLLPSVKVDISFC